MRQRTFDEWKALLLYITGRARRSEGAKRMKAWVDLLGRCYERMTKELLP